MREYLADVGVVDGPEAVDAVVDGPVGEPGAVAGGPEPPGGGGGAATAEGREGESGFLGGGGEVGVRR